MLANTPGIDIVPVAHGCESSRHLFQVQVESRDEVMSALNTMGIFPGVHYRDNTEYPVYALAAGTCPEAGRASREVISLPIHMRLAKPDIDLVAELVARYAR